VLSGGNLPPASWGVVAESMDPPMEPGGPGAAGSGHVKCGGAISTTIRLDVPAARRPPAVVVEERIYVSWSGTSGTLADGLTGVAGNANRGPYDIHQQTSATSGSRFLRRLTVFKNPGATSELAPVAAKAEGYRPANVPPPGPGLDEEPFVIPLSATASVVYSVVVLLPIVSGTNCGFGLPALNNWKTLNWTAAGQAIWTHAAGVPHPSYVRYDSTHFPDLTVLWSVGWGTLFPDDKPWKLVQVAVVYNRYAVRSADDFELGKWVIKAGQDPYRKFGLAIHDDVVDALRGMNHDEVGNSTPYSAAQLIADAKKATAQHLSAHGASAAVKADSGLVITAAAINQARNERPYGVPPFNVVFFASCDTAKVTLPPLASAYGIQNGQANRVYGGYNGQVYIAGVQAAARVFWQNFQKGNRAVETAKPAKDAYLEELGDVLHDDDLHPLLKVNFNQIELRLIGDQNTKLRGLYNLPLVPDGQGGLRPLPVLTWMVVYDINQGVLGWF
jgi:hypothetical protein